ncbi:hypothetical protein AC249_AIPGENE15853 [Exaiptasia diaphana]|nr:hypothetical protein AC249_AIPGENE15853 [Exaiptasia diaphana]
MPGDNCSVFGCGTCRRSKGIVLTCEKHFDPNDIEIFESAKMTKKRPKFGALPVLNMPQKSHQTQTTTTRPSGRNFVAGKEGSSLGILSYLFQKPILFDVL